MVWEALLRFKKRVVGVSLAGFLILYALFLKLRHRTFKSQILGLILSKRVKQIRDGLFEVGRVLGNKKHTLTVFVSLVDPHSFVLVQALALLKGRLYPFVELDVRFIHRLDPNVVLEQYRWFNWAFGDARELAELYGFQVPQSRVWVEKQTELTDTTVCDPPTTETELLKNVLHKAHQMCFVYKTKTPLSNDDYLLFSMEVFSVLWKTSFVEEDCEKQAEQMLEQLEEINESMSEKNKEL